MTPSIRVRGLNTSVTVDGQERPILVHVDLTLNAGDALALVGESGSGKSMTLRSLGGLLPDGFTTTGQIDVCGIDVLNATEAQLRNIRSRSLSYVFQDPRSVVNPLHTIERYLSEVIRERDGLNRIQARAKILATLDNVGLREPRQLLRQYPHELSGGMLQRVVLSAALLSGTDFILADEPTTALDVTTQSEVLAIIDTLRQERGLGLLFVTHDLDLAVAMCDRVAIMYAGRIVELMAGGGTELGARHPYTRDLFRVRPTMESDVDLAPIPGRAIAAFETTTACPYAPRCASRMDICVSDEPAWIPHPHGGAACHLLRHDKPVEQAALRERSCR